MFVCSALFTIFTEDVLHFIPILWQRDVDSLDAYQTASDFIRVLEVFSKIKGTRQEK